VVNNDRAQAASSVGLGELEFMVHRRTLTDDRKGVAEPLNETAFGDRGLVVSGRHWVNFTQSPIAADTARLAQNALFWDVFQTYSPLNGIGLDRYLADHHISISFINTPLPPNLELITVQIAPVAVNTNQSFLIRLAHQYSVNDPSPWAVNATVDLANLFSIPVTAITELTLTATQAAGGHQPYQWNTNTVDRLNDNQHVKARRRTIPAAGTTVTLQPMEVKTYSVQLAL